LAEREIVQEVGAMLNEGGAASALVRRFQEICRQLTQTHYPKNGNG
jgi:hypothetical protein